MPLITTGRTSGEPREIIIWFAAVGDRVTCSRVAVKHAHWVRNLQADPADPRAGSASGRSRVARGRSEGATDDPVAREVIAAKYGTTRPLNWLPQRVVARPIDPEREPSEAIGPRP